MKQTKNLVTVVSSLWTRYSIKKIYMWTFAHMWHPPLPLFSRSRILKVPLPPKCKRNHWMPLYRKNIVSRDFWSQIFLYHFFLVSYMSLFSWDCYQVFALIFRNIQCGPQKCPYFSLAITFTKIRKPSRFFLHSYWKFIELFWWEPL